MNTNINGVITSMGKPKRKRVIGYNMTRKGKLIHVKAYLRKKRTKKN